jgi:ankyrin repeat protein
MQLNRLLVLPLIAFAIVHLPKTLAADNPDLDAFITAVDKDDTGRVQDMLVDTPTLPTEMRDQDSTTAMHHLRSVKMAQVLLDAGGSLIAPDGQYKASPLRWAASRFYDAKTANPQLIQFLRSKGADEPDIFFAVAIGDVDRVKQLLAKDPTLVKTHDVDHDVITGGGSTPLHVAAYCGQVEVGKLLVENGADVHDRGGWGNTEALEKACWTGHLEMVEFLIDKGAKIDGTDNVYAHTPLYNAAVKGRLDIVKVLLAHGAKKDPSLVSAVEDASRKKGGDPIPGTPDDYKQILELLR